MVLFLYPCVMFDTLFFKFNDFYKQTYKSKARKIATVYVSFLQCGIVLLLGVFFAKFFSQMNVDTMSSSNGWILFVVVCIAIYFNNWMHYAGKRLTVKKAKKKGIASQENRLNILAYWMLPFATIALALIIRNAF